MDVEVGDIYERDGVVVVEEDDVEVRPERSQ